MPGRQIRNLANMQFWQSVLSEVEERTGSYPESLEGALAEWRATRGHSSESVTWDRLGRDGRCDMRNILAYESASLATEHS